MDVEDDAFWRDMETDDPLNRAIWNDSVAVQLEIASREELRAVNSIGAQQAMIEELHHSDLICLPWVPDLLLADWQAESALLVVGSAYAGFIREYSGNKGMPIAEYIKAYERRSVKLFLDSFREWVIPEWRPYYGFVRGLINRLKASGDAVGGVAVFDACRASFVCRSQASVLAQRPLARTESPALRRDRPGDSVVRCQPAIFAKYVESGTANEWLWERIRASNATRILALGTIAEHALLRCFARKLGLEHADIRSFPENHEPKRISRFSDWERNTEWALDYADDRHKLKHWRNDGWWEITGQDTPLRRVLAIPHPSQNRGRKEWILERLARMSV